ncbi:hypothetical protein L9F63_028226 [Diploptera punctata]|uniref:Uncharacterized protein n=1 Tax=Diploptera punctata TaxID=6984 RepID=A0AAD7ZW63_DIPPU|nr:hypothetical protein L9F63_028226 [Diploptera punctata]
MARDKKFGKRKFYGNIFTSSKKAQNSNQCKKQSDVNRPSVVNSSGSATVDEVMSNPSTSGCVNVNRETPPSASRRKLYFVNNNCTEFSVNSDKISSGFHFVDVEQLSALKGLLCVNIVKKKIVGQCLRM